MHYAYFSKQQSNVFKSLDSLNDPRTIKSGVVVWRTAERTVEGKAPTSYAVAATWVADKPPNFGDVFDLGEVVECLGDCFAARALNDIQKPMAVPYDRRGALITGTLSAAEVAEAEQLALQLAEADPVHGFHP